MKHLVILPLFTFHFSLFTLSASAAVPLKWTVETSRLAPAVFDVVRGETIALEAAFNSSGKPFAMDGESVSIFWQTNGMGNAWWTAPAVATSNLVRATFTPEMDPGAATVNGFLGSSGSIYRAAFTFRFRHGPGAVPNTLPLPVPVIDFAKVRVLNPPWSGGGGGGVDTNAVIDIIREQLATNGIRSVDGAARPLPRYLHALDFCDTYPADAAWYYAQPQDYGSCSAVRDGGFLYRNYDWTFDDAAEFVVRMSAAEGRFASVGVANVGTNLTEDAVTSGKWSRFYKCLPGHTVDGINENGVCAEVNVVGGEPQWRIGGDIHPLGAVRWVLDNATSAEMAASNLAVRIAFPAGWTQNFHWMIADERETYIVANGNYYECSNRVALTNFPLKPTREPYGEGQERYDALIGGANITSQWWTLTYTAAGYRASDLQGLDTNLLFRAWAATPKEAHRGETFGDKVWWQTVHTSIYDITNRTLRVAVQEVDDWYTFQVPSAGGVKPEAVREIVEPMIGAATNGLRRVEDFAVYAIELEGIFDYTGVSESLREALKKAEPIRIYEENGRWWTEPIYFDDYWIYITSSEKADGSIKFTFENTKRYIEEDVVARKKEVFRATSDRLATTNGVAQAVAQKRDKTDGDFTGTHIFMGIPYSPSEGMAGVRISTKNENPFAGRLELGWDTGYNMIVANGEYGNTYLDVGYPYIGISGTLNVKGMDVSGTTHTSTITSTSIKKDGKEVATEEQVEAKQDALPYPTNAIPTDAISGLVQKIHDEAPAPGNYAAVSNAAMNAIQAVTNADANLIYTITSDGAEPRFYFTPVGAINAED